MAELEAETEKLRYRVERLGCSLKEGAPRPECARGSWKSGGDRGLEVEAGVGPVRQVLLRGGGMSEKEV